MEIPGYARPFAAFRAGLVPLTFVLVPCGQDGQGGIRTLDTLASMPPFQGGAFNHSATCPEPLQGGNLVRSERKINVSLTGE